MELCRTDIKETGSRDGELIEAEMKGLQVENMTQLRLTTALANPKACEGL